MPPRKKAGTEVSNPEPAPQNDPAPASDPASPQGALEFPAGYEGDAPLEYIVKEPIRFENQRREIGDVVWMLPEEAALYGVYVELKSAE